MSHLYKFGESRFGGAWVVVLMVLVVVVAVASVVRLLAMVKLASLLALSVSFVLVALLTSAPMPTGGSRSVIELEWDS